MLCSGLFNQQIHNSTFPNDKRELRSETFNTDYTTLVIERANGRSNAPTIWHDYEIITSSQGVICSHVYLG